MDFACDPLGSCRSPKYSSTLSTAQEHEGRLILKVTNGHSQYVGERPADPSPVDVEPAGEPLIYRPFKCVQGNVAVPVAGGGKKR